MNSLLRRCVTSLAVAGFLFQAPDAAQSQVWPDGPNGDRKGPADARHWIEPADFEQVDVDTWISGWVDAPFPYEELIYSWEVRLPDGEGFRLYVEAGFTDDTTTAWVYAGYWGDVDINTTERRSNPQFEGGRLLMDEMLLDKPASRYRFKVACEGQGAGLTTLPRLHVVTTTNSSPKPDGNPNKVTGSTPILDLPLRRQMSSTGERMPDRCQSAAIATALEYFGKDLPLETIEPMIYDPEYRYPGIWPRTIAAATQVGFKGYIDRFRDWDSVRQAIAENKVILVSMRMPEGDYIAPPYASMGGHIVALNGITDDGRVVVVTDSALGQSGRGYRCQWLREDFEKVWWATKGGVAMVIEPPEGAELRAITDLGPFPSDPVREAETNLPGVEE